MIYEEASKPKIRVSMDPNDELINPEELKVLNFDKPRKSEYGWSLEPPKLIH
jgi:hypothetical protein